VTVRGPRSSHRGERGGHVHREAGVERLPDDPEHGIAEPVALVLDHERVAVLVVEQDPLDEQAPGGLRRGAGGAAAGPGALDELRDVQLDGFERDDVHAAEATRLWGAAWTVSELPVGPHRSSPHSRLRA
jgi:hypothetical protein